MRIQQAFASLQPDEIRRAKQALYERVDFCTDDHGTHFEQL